MIFKLSSYISHLNDIMSVFEGNLNLIYKSILVDS
jgi:hypothetical protein